MIKKLLRDAEKGHLQLAKALSAKAGAQRKQETAEEAEASAHGTPAAGKALHAARAKEKAKRFGDFDLDELKDEVGRNFLHAAAAAGHPRCCAVAIKQGGVSPSVRPSVR